VRRTSLDIRLEVVHTRMQRRARWPETHWLRASQLRGVTVFILLSMET